MATYSPVHSITCTDHWRNTSFGQPGPALSWGFRAGRWMALQHVLGGPSGYTTGRSGLRIGLISGPFPGPLFERFLRNAAYTALNLKTLEKGVQKRVRFRACARPVPGVNALWNTSPVVTAVPSMTTCCSTPADDAFPERLQKFPDFAKNVFL